MRAIALTIEGQSAALTELPEPDLPADGALIEVHATSVNGFDVFQASGGLMGMMPHVLPTIIGRDFSGVVRAVGSDRGGRPGRRCGPRLHHQRATAPRRDLVGTRRRWREPGPRPEAGRRRLAGRRRHPARRCDGPGRGRCRRPPAGRHRPHHGRDGRRGGVRHPTRRCSGSAVLASAKPGDDTDFVLGLGAAEAIDYTLTGLGDTVRALTPGDSPGSSTRSAGTRRSVPWRPSSARAVVRRRRSAPRTLTPWLPVASPRPTSWAHRRPRSSPRWPVWSPRGRFGSRSRRRSRWRTSVRRSRRSPPARAGSCVLRVAG